MTTLLIIFSYTLLITFAIALFYILVRSFSLRTKKWVIISLLFLFLSCASTFIIFFSSSREFSRPFFIVSIWFLFGGFLFMQSLLFFRSKQSRFTDRLVGIILMAEIPLVIICFTWLYFSFDHEGEKIHVVDNYYIQTGDYDGQWYGYLYEEKFFFVEGRHISLPEFNWYDPIDSIRVVSFKNENLEMNLFQKGIATNMKIDLRFDAIADDHEGIRCVWRDNKMGAIDSTGKLIIPIKYSSLAGCFNGLISATVNAGPGGFLGNGKSGFINRNGETVIPFIFDGGTGNFLSDSAVVNVNHVGYRIDKKGKILSKQKY